MEKNFTTAIAKDNEVVKAIDINYNFDSQVDNFSIFAKVLLEPEKDFVVNGEVYSLGGMNLGIKPFFALHNLSGECFVSTESITDGIFVESASSPRIDIIQIRPKEIEFDEQARAFLDFDTKIETIQNVFTKKRIGVDVVVKKGSLGSSIAPATDDGFIKLAEIYVPANVNSLTDENIKNITADVKGLENDLWTNEKKRTYNLKYLSEINSELRNEHNADGTHKKNIIGKDELDYGVGDNQINATILPVGSKISVDNEEKAANTSIKEVITSLADKITTLFDNYINKGGVYNFNGEVKISSLIDENNALTNALIISADGKGNANLKIGDKTILTLANNVLRLPSGYTASLSNDVITKSVTDAILVEIENINNELENVKKTISSNSEFANNIYSRYSFSDISITVATTANITLSGVQTIDGVSLSASNIVLVKNQTDKKQNGIYVVQTGGWDRHTSFNSENTLKHKLFLIFNGSSNKGKVFYIPSESFTVGTDEISFSESIFTANISAYTIPMRDASGKIQTATPTANTDVANKSYVDTAETSAKNLANAIGVLDVSKGGTGATTAKVAQNNLLTMTESTNAVTDADLIVQKYTTPTETTGTLLYKKTSAIWTYIQGKISSVLGLTSASYGGKATTAGTADTAKTCTGNAATATKATQDSGGQQINTTYIKGLSVTGQTITYTKGDGTTGTITTQDSKVQQTSSTANASYPILLSSSTANGTRGTYFDSGVTLNPSTNFITATTSQAVRLKVGASVSRTGSNIYIYQNRTYSEVLDEGTFYIHNKGETLQTFLIFIDGLLSTITRLDVNSNISIKLDDGNSSYKTKFSVKILAIGM